jgi:carbon storage regulator CsrA
MLVLSRRISEKIVFPTLKTSVEVVAVKPGVVRLGIEAPQNVPVFRQEVLQREGFVNVAPARSPIDELTHAVNNRLNSATVGLALLRRQLELGLTAEMAGTLARIENTLESLRQLPQIGHAGQTRPAGRRRRALLVEDDRNECELLAAFLRLAGLDVNTAGDGADALEHLRNQGKPDVLVLDMMLPRCDGPTTVRAIRQDPRYSGLKIFGVTGTAYEQFGLAEGPAGIDRWFKKPLNPEVLLRELTRPCR